MATEFPSLQQPMVNGGGVVTPPWYRFFLGIVKGAFSLPVGTVVRWPQLIPIPAGYLQCNGQAVSRRGLPELFLLLGTHYGVGDGSTTFNLPTYTTADPLYIIKT